MNLKKVTNRVITELSKEDIKTEIFKMFDILYHLSVVDEEDFEEEQKNSDISNLIEQECSQEECKLIKKHIIHAVKKELKKKHSLLVTTKLLIALKALEDDHEKVKMKKRVKVCNRYLENFDWYCSQKETLKIIRDLENLQR